MNFSELILLRQSQRTYSDKPVEKDKLDICINSSRMAPSACNAQPWKFVVVDEPVLKEKVAKETYNTFFSFNKFAHTAPAIVVIVMEKPNTNSQIGGRIKNKDFYLIDIGIAAEHFCLQAAELGLGTCMMGWFNEKKIQKLLNIPDKRQIGLLITVGYPKSEDIRQKKRKEINEMSNYNKYK
jgi:nitroreductase